MRSPTEAECPACEAHVDADLARERVYCPDCGDEVYRLFCAGCGGAGEVRTWIPHEYQFEPWREEQECFQGCQECDGEGYVGYVEEPCSTERETWIRATAEETA